MKEKLSLWWKEKGRPMLTAWTTEWWMSIGDHPRAHFVSMCFGILLYVGIKFLARLVV